MAEPTFSDEHIQRYERALHAMQTGVMFDQEHGSDDGSPKHLRVGVNSAMVNAAALASLLVAKGVITWDEYGEALATAAEDEAARYEQILRQRYGLDIHLA